MTRQPHHDSHNATPDDTSLGIASWGVSDCLHSKNGRAKTPHPHTENACSIGITGAAIGSQISITRACQKPAHWASAISNPAISQNASAIRICCGGRPLEIIGQRPSCSRSGFPGDRSSVLVERRRA